MAIGRTDACNPFPSTHPSSTSTLQVGTGDHVLEGGIILRTFWYVNATCDTLIHYLCTYFTHRPCACFPFAMECNNDVMFLHV